MTERRFHKVVLQRRTRGVEPATWQALDRLVVDGLDMHVPRDAEVVLAVGDQPQRLTFTIYVGQVDFEDTPE